MNSFKLISNFIAEMNLELFSQIKDVAPLELVFMSKSGECICLHHSQALTAYYR